MIGLGACVVLSASTVNPPGNDAPPRPGEVVGGQTNLHGIHSHNSTPVSLRYIPTYRRGAAMYTGEYQHVLGGVKALSGAPPYSPPKRDTPQNSSLAANQSNTTNDPYSDLNGVPRAIWEKYCDPQVPTLNKEERTILASAEIPEEFVDRCGFRYK